MERQILDSRVATAATGGGPEVEIVVTSGKARSDLGGRLTRKCLEFTQWSLLSCVGIQFKINNRITTSDWIRASKCLLCTASASAGWHRFSLGQTVVASDKNLTEKEQNNSLMSAWPQMLPSYFTLAVWFATPSFVYVSYLHELSVVFSFFGRLRAFSLRRALRRQWKKKPPLFWGAFVWQWKKPLHFLYVQHGESTKWTRWKLIKIHRFTEQFIIPPPASPHPLGLEVTAACDKRAHSFINVRFFHSSRSLKIPKSAWIFHFREKMCP